jgi:hypothetical protein
VGFEASVIHDLHHLRRLHHLHQLCIYHTLHLLHRFIRQRRLYQPRSTRFGAEGGFDVWIGDPLICACSGRVGGLPVVGVNLARKWRGESPVRETRSPCYLHARCGDFFKSGSAWQRGRGKGRKDWSSGSKPWSFAGERGPWRLR